MLGLFSVDTTIKAEIFDQENIQYDPGRRHVNFCRISYFSKK